MRAAGYIRVSTEEQRRDGWNLDADRERIQEIAAERGWELVTVYDDGGRQGDDPDRPGFNAMLDALGDLDVIVMRSLDRLSRDTFLFALATKAIRTAGVSVETFNGPVDLDTPEGELSSNVLAAIARFEKRQIGVRVKQAMGARARAGHHHGRAPFGYDVGMTVNESQAATIIRVFHEYAIDGISQREIARRLNREGIAAQRGRWTQGAISKTLHMPVYIGKVRFNGEILDGNHEAIISPEVWAKAQALRQANTSSRRAKNPAGPHLLGGGMLRCHCGAGMYAITRIRPPRTDQERYHCSRRQREGLDACDQPSVKREPIDEAIYRFVVDTALDLEATKITITEQNTAKLAGLQALRHQATTDEATAEARLTRVRRDYQDGKLDADDWSEQRAELTEALEAARAQAQRLSEQHDDLAAGAEQIDINSAVLAHLTALRASILGEARDGSAGGVEAFRAALRRLFVGFDLVRFPSLGGGDTEGVIWPQDRAIHVADYVLIPRVRPEALDFDSESWELHRTTLGGLDARTPLSASKAAQLFTPIAVIEAKS